jgi:hypothetical protein
MPTGANRRKSQTSTPASKPPPESAEDLAQAIFRDADRKLAEKLAGKKARLSATACASMS